PAVRKWTPFGVLVLATGALLLIFGARETSDFWVDALMLWWQRMRPQYGPIRRLVIFLDNGPNKAGTRAQFLKGMVECADRAGLVGGGGDGVVVISAVSQQVQPDRAVLVGAGEEVGRGAAEQLAGDPGAGQANDLAGEASAGGMPAG